MDCPVGRSNGNAGVSGPITLLRGVRPGNIKEMKSIDVDCPTGYATDTLASACDACPLGHFALTPGGHAKPCAMCSREYGTQLPVETARRSTRGYIASNASSACKTCPGGRFLEDDSDILQRMTALETAPSAAQARS